MAENFNLLKKFAESGDESAFRDIVTRHVDLVYSTALRLVNGDTHLAEDITQKVFADLARKARSLSRNVVLPGWLYEAARFTAANTVRGEQRRKAREHEAMAMQHLASESLSDWEAVASHLDAAMAELNAFDRNALLLRYFQNQDFRSIGRALGVSDDSAQKRVSRAVERLREYLLKRDVTVASSMLALLITTHSVQAAPANLATSLIVAAAKQSVAGSAMVKGTVKSFAWTKAKAAVVAGVIILFAVGAVTIRSRYSALSENRHRLPIGNGTAKITMGGGHGVILASDGSLWSWGENYLGWPVLGLGNPKNQAELRRIGDDNDWIDVSTSFTHCLALKSDGTIWGWGENLHGELGLGTSGRRDSERSIPVLSVPGSNWNQVAAGGSHSLALQKDGTLWAWGNNWAGQLGIGASTREMLQVTQVSTSTNWIKSGLLACNQWVCNPTAVFGFGVLSRDQRMTRIECMLRRVSLRIATGQRLDSATLSSSRLKQMAHSGPGDVTRASTRVRRYKS
ncbi:MAG TPA: sigma-70 family RNA polymerase sigma factor [Candidatus Acidoferrum sp.]|nr:sigma-70 family RNA polymerase sigma factor [Candidatus Acidoferrum sp.]